MHWMDTLERLNGLLTVVLIAVIVGACVYRSRRATRVVRCSKCGYDLSGQTDSSDAVCPECGSDLAHWGIVRLDTRTKLKGRFDTHARVRSGRWWIVAMVLWLLGWWAWAMPPVAFVHSWSASYTLAQTPAGIGTITVRSAARWAEVDWASDRMGDESHIGAWLEDTREVSSFVPGTDPIDLKRFGTNFDRLMAWVRSIDPAIDEVQAEAIALVLFAPDEEAYRVFLANGGEEIERRVGTLPVSPTVGTHSWSSNGVAMHNRLSPRTGVMASLRMTFGRPSLAHNAPRNWWRLAGMCLALVALAAVFVLIPGWWRRFTCSTYRGWRAGLADGV